MANKESILIVTDVGASMYKQFSHKQDKTLLEIAINCTNMLIIQKMFNSKQTDIGLIRFGMNQSDDFPDGIEFF